MADLIPGSDLFKKALESSGFTLPASLRSDEPRIIDPVGAYESYSGVHSGDKREAQMLRQQGLYIEHTQLPAENEVMRAFSAPDGNGLNILGYWRLVGSQLDVNTIVSSTSFKTSQNFDEILEIARKNGADETVLKRLKERGFQGPDIADEDLEIGTLFPGDEKKQKQFVANLSQYLMEKMNAKRLYSNTGLGNLSSVIETRDMDLGIPPRPGDPDHIRQYKRHDIYVASNDATQPIVVEDEANFNTQTKTLKITLPGLAMRETHLDAKATIDENFMPLLEGGDNRPLIYTPSQPAAPTVEYTAPYEKAMSVLTLRTAPGQPVDITGLDQVFYSTRIDVTGSPVIKYSDNTKAEIDLHESDDRVPVIVEIPTTKVPKFRIAEDDNKNHIENAPVRFDTVYDPENAMLRVTQQRNWDFRMFTYSEDIKLRFNDSDSETTYVRLVASEVVERDKYERQRIEEAIQTRRDMLGELERSSPDRKPISAEITELEKELKDVKKAQSVYRDVPPENIIPQKELDKLTMQSDRNPSEEQIRLLEQWVPINRDTALPSSLPANFTIRLSSPGGNTEDLRVNEGRQMQFNSTKDLLQAMEEASVRLAGLDAQDRGKDGKAR